MTVFHRLLLTVATVSLAACNGTVLRTLPASSATNGVSIAVLDYALPHHTAEVSLKGTATGSGPVDLMRDLQIVRKVHPDPSRGTYLLNYVASPLSDDKLTVTTDDKTRLLKTINSAVKDKTSETIVAVAKTVGSLSGAGFLNDAPGGGNDATLVPVVEFDPMDPEGIARANAALGVHGVTVVCKDCAVPAQGAIANAPAGAAWALPGIPRTLMFCAGDTVVCRDVVFVTASRAPAFSVPVARTAFADTDYIYAFTDGMITSFTTNRGSAALGAAGAGQLAVDAGLDARSMTIGKDAASITQETSLLQEERKRLAAELALLEERRKLAAFIAENPAPDGAGPGIPAVADDLQEVNQ